MTVRRMTHFIPWAHTGNLLQPKLTVKKQRENLEYEGEWSRKVEIRTRKKFLAVDKAQVAIFWPTPGFSGRTFVSPGFSTEGTIISASTISHRCKKMERHKVANRNMPVITESEHTSRHNTCNNSENYDSMLEACQNVRGRAASSFSQM